MVAMETSPTVRGIWTLWRRAATLSTLRFTRGNAMTTQVYSTAQVQLHFHVTPQSATCRHTIVGWYFCRTQKGLCVQELQANGADNKPVGICSHALSPARSGWPQSWRGLLTSTRTLTSGADSANKNRFFFRVLFKSGMSHNILTHTDTVA